MEIGILLVSAFLLAAMVPVAILISRDRLRRYRSWVLIALEDWMYKTARRKPLPSFEVARIKYELSPRAASQIGQTNEHTVSKTADANAREAARLATRGSLTSFILPAMIYSALSGLGFITALILASDPKFWEAPNFILSGMHDVTATLSSADLTVYQWNSGAAITAGFLGAYLFTLQYLVGRVRNYELSPTSFLVASMSLIEGCFVVSIARHFIFSATPHASFGALAFLLGYFPTFGITWLVERMRVRNLKRTAPAAYDRRFVMPTDMIDGVDMLMKFRLMEAGVHDVQNLATANPVLLYVETPFSLITILDWIAQAQLIIAFGGTIAVDLRTIGLRTIFDVAAMGKEPETRRMVMEKVWPDMVPLKDKVVTPELFHVLLEVITGDIHVRRLQTFWSVMGSLVEAEDDGSSCRGKEHGRPVLKEAAD
jgi:hypothetical protein